MVHQGSREHKSHAQWLGHCVAGVVIVGGGSAAFAVPIDAGPDWKINWDNSVNYNLGIRAQRLNDKIGNNPVFSESDYLHPKRGDVVTNRFSLLSEADVVYKDTFGFRVSAAAWKDFAYGDEVKNNPGLLAPGFPYSAAGSYPNNRFSNYTKRFYDSSGELLDAFVFGSADIAGHKTSVKLGKLTRYWGNALFFGTQALGYSQNAADNIKGAAAPGTQAKELAMPRAQLLASTEITPDVSVEAQYFFKFEGNRLPEGGTYLGTAGFLFNGPSQVPGTAITRTADYLPKDNNSNFGVKASWSPSWLKGVVSAYYRRLDETQPWAPLFDAFGGYHLSYAQNVKLYGLSLEKQIGDVSTGFEVSYRKNTGLNSSVVPTPADLANTQGARGNTINAVANVVSGLTPTPLYDTGIVIAEVAYTHLTSVTSNGSVYDGTSNLSGCPTGNWRDGCSTRNALIAGVLFQPSWLQVYPGLDLEAPLFLMYGVKGNVASLGAPVGQGGMVYTAGLRGIWRNLYKFTLQYNGYHAKTNGESATLAGPFYSSGNRTHFYNDKGWVSLTFQTSF